jgi:hypothetical protein
VPLYSLDDVRVTGPGTWQPVPVPVPLERVIRAALLNALAFTEGNQKAAARALAIPPSEMRRRMRTSGIPQAWTGVRRLRLAGRPRTVSGARVT